MQRQKNGYLICLLCICLMGCSSFTDFKRGNKFDDRIKLFSQAIRWSDFELAQGFIRTREGRVQNQKLDYLDEIKVTKYLATNKTPEENFNVQASDIILVYDVDYYVNDSYKVKQLRYEQLWWYDTTTDNWFLESGLPKFEN